MAGLVSSTLLVAVAIGLLVSLLTKVRQWLRMPPGPWGVPFLGYIPWVSPVSPWDTYTELKKKYGPVFSMNLCGTPQIILNDWKSINEAYSMTVFNERPIFLLFEIVNKRHTGLSANGKTWHDNRSFLLRSMRSFGVGRSSMESLVAHEVLSLVDSYKADVGKAMEIDRRLDVAVMNIVWKICTGKQTSLEDKKAHRLLDVTNEFGALISQLGPAQFYPSLISIVPKFKKVMKTAKDLAPEFSVDFLKEIEEHKQFLKENPEHQPQDVVDDYLSERAKKAMSDPETAASFADEHLLSVMTALFAAGTDTTATTVRYACLFFAHHRDVQKRCQEELDAVVGRDRLPSWDLDKPRLTYVEATIKEIQRVADITPLGVPHAAAEDTEFRGYFIPKGSWVVANMNACHRDPKYWPDPERFDPTRFIDEGGRLKRDTPSFLPFCAGKRRCLGENLANMEIFIYVAYLLHHFIIKFPDGFSPDLRTNAGDPITRRPAPFKIILNNR